MHPNLKRSLHWAGSALALLGIAFVALRLRNYSAEINFTRFNVTAWSVIAGLVLIYGLANGMLALAWWNLLKQFGVNTSRGWAVRVYGISQLAKYVPGNIFHLAGRQGMGMAAGVSGWALAKSSVWELGLLSITGGLFGLLAAPLLVKNVPIAIAVLVFAGVVGVAAALLWRFIGTPVARAFVYQVSFLAISGWIFVGVIGLLVESPESGGFPWLPLGGAYVLAWLAGLITPGAPAGVGVRELVLLYLLKGMIGEADLLLAVVLGRMITVAGDLGFFGIATLMNVAKFRLTVL
jgi:uncharacterized membrane protein YbhN (UPF0104 family)